MSRIIESIVAVVLVIIVVTFMTNHGMIDFSGVDKAATIAKDAVNSKEGKEIINEFKDISNDVVSQMATGTIDLIKNNIIKQEKTPAELISVVDGDTLIVKLNNENIKVRLIGIDTPESVNPDEEKNSIYGEMASVHTKELLKDVKTVYLTFDNDLEDDYGRCLAYVWIVDVDKDTTENIKNYSLNGMILRDGYAKEMEIAPNTKYAYSFSLIKQEAKNNNVGLWKDNDASELLENKENS